MHASIIHPLRLEPAGYRLPRLFANAGSIVAALTGADEADKSGQPQSLVAVALAHGCPGRQRRYEGDRATAQEAPLARRGPSSPRSGGAMIYQAARQ